MLAEAQSPGWLSFLCLAFLSLVGFLAQVVVSALSVVSKADCGSWVFVVPVSGCGSSLCLVLVPTSGCGFFCLWLWFLPLVEVPAFGCGFCMIVDLVLSF